MALTTYAQIKEQVIELLPELLADKYPEDLLSQYADSEIPAYTYQTQQEWVELEFADQNRWRDCFALSDLGEDNASIDYLMRVDLFLYYEGLFARAYRELTEDAEQAVA